MSVSASSWLPGGAFDIAAVGAVFASPVAAWSADWFARVSAAPTSIHSRTDRSPETLAIAGERSSLALSEAGKLQLLEAALDVDLGEALRGECDSHVLDTLVGEIAGDLVARLDNMLASDHGSASGDVICVGISLGKSEVLAFEVAEASIVPLLKARLGAARPALEPVKPRSEALRATKLKAYGNLGQAQITLDELNELAVGDVLVIDRTLGERVALTFAGQVRPFAHGALRSERGRLSVCL